MWYIKKYSFLIIFAITTATGCKKQETVSLIEKGSLTISPVDFNEFVGLVPLGAMNPPSHTFPTDHMYFYYKDIGISHNIKAPGDMRIFSISRNRHNVDKPGETLDFIIRFGTRGKTELYFYHVSSLSQKLLNAANNFSNAKCKSYEVNGSIEEHCDKEVSLNVTAGEIIGTGNTVEGQLALDMGMIVNSIPVCPLDYFEPTIKKALEQRISNYNGLKKRVMAPLCGEVNQNIPGTAQGSWIKKGLPTYPEDPHIALVKDEIDPTIPIFSTGKGITGQTPGTYTFTKLGFGYINRLFKDVKADGKVYCYNLKQTNGILIPNASIILKLENDTELSIEKRNCDCSCQPYTFTNNKASYTKK